MGDKMRAAIKAEAMPWPGRDRLVALAVRDLWDNALCVVLSIEEADRLAAELWRAAREVEKREEAR